MRRRAAERRKSAAPGAGQGNPPATSRARYHGNRQSRASAARGDAYPRFDLIDGTHPWREVAADACVDYRVRYRPGGRVLFFNFPLARELGLVPGGHPERMNVRLEARILSAFSLQIINEYDLAHPEKLGRARPRPNAYMATRYLQLQHRDKRGRNSGDGRSIWNGCIKAGGLLFDVSSRGTGATILSPGASEANRPLPTGEKRFGYASGRADLDEMLGSALMSEIFYRQGLPTERCLAVIDYGDGTAVGVRTAPNLVRPAHIFRYLKMGKHGELRSSLEYFLRRQEENGFWKLPASGESRLARALELIAKSYGRLAALLEEEYIFNWLSWDGDNVLADGSILDYGSIRQFAAKHNKYRYEDVDRFSTCLSEQRAWARLMVQAFAQAADFVTTGEKRNLRNFRDTPCLALFDREFRDEGDRRLLWRVGFTPAQAERLMSKRRDDVEALRRAVEYFEDVKVARGPEKLPDGVTHKPVFLIRSLLRELPNFFLGEAQGDLDAVMDPARFCRVMAASYASRKDMQMTDGRASRARELQECWRRLVRAAGEGDERKTLASLAERAAVINHEHRMTGDGLIWIINEILAFKDKLDWEELHEAVETFIDSQVLVPGKWKPLPEAETKPSRLKDRLLLKIKQDLELYKETI